MPKTLGNPRIPSTKPVSNFCGPCHESEIPLIIPARDPKQCGVSKQIMHYNVGDDVNVADDVDDDDGNVDDDDADDDDDDAGDDNNDDADDSDDDDDDDDDDDESDDDDDEEDDDDVGDDAVGDAAGDGDDDDDVDDVVVDDDDGDDSGDDGDDYDDGDERNMMMSMWMLLRRRRRMMLRRKTDHKTGKHTLCEPAQSKCTRTFHKSHFVEIYRKSAVCQARDTCLVRACAVEMHMDMSEETFCAEI